MGERWGKKGVLVWCRWGGVGLEGEEVQHRRSEVNNQLRGEVQGKVGGELQKWVGHLMRWILCNIKTSSWHQIINAHVHDVVHQ